MFPKGSLLVGELFEFVDSESSAEEAFFVVLRGWEYVLLFFHLARVLHVFNCTEFRLVNLVCDDYVVVVQRMLVTL